MLNPAMHIIVAMMLFIASGLDCCIETLEYGINAMIAIKTIYNNCFAVVLPKNAPSFLVLVNDGAYCESFAISFAGVKNAKNGLQIIVPIIE